ncbi:MAG: TRAP transporter large permease subunit, partial [Oscillospiraceae bacterium]
MIGTGIISLILFIAVIVILNVFFKRNIALSMAIAWLLCGFLGGSNFPTLLKDSLLAGVTNSVILPSMFFCFMSSIMKRTGIVHRLVNILNAAFGRIPGGAGYVSTLASAVMGSVSGSGSGNAAVSGSITIPWMIGSGFSVKTASTIVCGNATLGMSIPPSTSMFMLLAMPVIAGSCETGELYLACMCGGMWILSYRLLTVFYYTRKFG